jgi:DNA polymerase (family 10)
MPHLRPDLPDVDAGIVPDPGCGMRHPGAAGGKRLGLPAPDNAEIADVLERIADLLQAQDANRWRVRAYRAAAAFLRDAPPVAETLAAEGRAGLERLPGIGRAIASQIEEYAHSGRLALLDRLEGQVSPEDLFTTLPGIGDELAARIHRELGVETLEDLAAHDGRLARVAGFGERRVRALRDALAGTLGRSARRRARRRRWLEIRAEREAEGREEERPDVATLLAVDREYRRRAEAGELRRITPRRFNPGREAWLPVLHTEKDGWSFTAIFSNTARAHELGRTRDWVVIFYERDGEEDQCTVVTEHAGRLEGRRVVRGREVECLRHYGGATA